MVPAQATKPGAEHASGTDGTKGTKPLFQGDEFVKKLFATLLITCASAVAWCQQPVIFGPAQIDLQGRKGVMFYATNYAIGTMWRWQTTTNISDATSWVTVTNDYWVIDNTTQNLWIQSPTLFYDAAPMQYTRCKQVGSNYVFFLPGDPRY